MKKSAILFFSVLLLSTGKLAAQPCISLAPGSSANTIVCLNSPIVDVVYNLHQSVNSVTFAGSLPTGVTGAHNGNTYTISGTPSVSGIFNYTLTTGGCIETVTGSITVNTLPIVSAGNNGPLCEGRDLNLYGSPSGASTYLWKGPSGFSSSDQNPVIPNVTTAQSGQYDLLVTDANGCQNTASTQVTVNSLPVASASSNSPVCVGSTINLTGNGSGTIISYSWTGPGGWSSNLQNPSIPNAAIANSGTYILTVRNNNNCEGQAATAVVVNDLPNATLTCSDPDNIICRGTSVTFTATGGISYNFRVGGVTVQNGVLNTYTTTSLTNGQVVDVVVTASGGCNAISPAITMTVHPLPVPTISSSDGDNIFCAGTPVTFTASGGSSYNFRVSGISVQSGISNTYTTSSLVNGQIVDVIVTNNNGCSATSAGIINTVNSLPVPVLTSSDPDNTFCAGTPVLFTASGGVNYNFRVGGVSVQNSSSPNYSTSSLTNGQVVDVVVTNAGGCSATSSGINNTVLPLPVPVLTSSDADNIFCAGNSVTFTASGGVAYNFRVNGLSVQSGTSTTFTTTSLTNGQVVDVIVTNANGCSAVSAGITNTVNPMPVIIASNNGPICEGSPLLLTGSPSFLTSYSWTGPNGFTSSLQNPQVSQEATVFMSGVYTLTVTTSNGCVGTDTTHAAVYAVPVSNAGLGGTECDLDFVLNAVPSAGAGLWSLVTGPGLSTFSPGPTAPNATVTVSAYGTYTFRWTETSGPCTSSSVVTVNFYQKPVADPGTGGDACDLSFALNAVPSAGTGAWRMISGTGTALFVPNANTPSATVTVSEYGTKVFQWKETNGICLDSADVTVNFYQQPVAIAGTGGNNCGLSFNLGAVPSTGTGTWTRISGPGNVNFNPDANAPDAGVTVTEYGTHAFVWTEVNGTCSSSDTIEVLFIMQPPANGGSGGDECDKDFILNAVPGAGIGTWVMVNGPGQATFSPNANQYNATVSVTQFGAYDFAWTVENSLCTSTDIIRVTFHDLPQISAGEDIALCKGNSIQLNALGAGTFLWTPSDNLSNPVIPNPFASPLETTAYTVTLTDRFGCKNSDQIIVDVREQPIAYAGEDQVLNFIFETRLAASELGLKEEGEWRFITGDGIFSDPNDNRAYLTELALGDNKLLWTVTNGACPPSYDTLNIQVNDLLIPTLITPNLDGRNDFFVIGGLETIGATSLMIFNRWGAQVFHSDVYDNTWDGVDDQGDPLSDDTYFYVLKPGNGKSRSGYIVIRR